MAGEKWVGEVEMANGEVWIGEAKKHLYIELLMLGDLSGVETRIVLIIRNGGWGTDEENKVRNDDLICLMAFGVKAVYME